MNCAGWLFAWLINTGAGFNELKKTDWMPKFNPVWFKSFQTQLQSLIKANLAPFHQLNPEFITIHSGFKFHSFQSGTNFYLRFNRHHYSFCLVHHTSLHFIITFLVTFRFSVPAIMHRDASYSSFTVAILANIESPILLLIILCLRE